MKKNTIRLNESQLHSLIKESVKKVLKEYNEYDQYDDRFDEPNYLQDSPMDSIWFKIVRGQITDNKLASLVDECNYLDFGEIYYPLKDDSKFGKKYPKFIRKWEMLNDWARYDEEYDDIWNDKSNLGYGLYADYADAEHENGNRLENPFDVLRKKGEKTTGKRLYSPVVMSDDGAEEEDKAFNGTRASIKKFGNYN